MNVTAAIAAVYGVLKAVPGVGVNVYDQVRYANDDATFNELFLDSVTDPAQPEIHAWMVTREATVTKDEVMQAASATHTIVMTGYRGFKDNATEPIWQAEVNAVCDAFFPYSTRHFNGAFDWSGPPQVEGIKLVWFRNALCHTARIVHTIREFPLN